MMTFGESLVFVPVLILGRFAEKCLAERADFPVLTIK